MEKVYTNYRAERFLKKYIPVSKSQLVKNINQVKIKPPLVLKIMSNQVIHKTDFKAVRFVDNHEELIKEFGSLLKLAKKKRIRLDGILVQKFVEGEQLIIGIKKDPVFNHVILFGMGGIFTEILDDTSIRKCPISLKDADDMINELRSSKLFHGFRGIKLNVNLLKKSLVSISKLPLRYKNIEELDINPFILNEKEGRVVDARVLFK